LSLRLARSQLKAGPLPFKARESVAKENLWRPLHLYSNTCSPRVLFIDFRSELRKKCILTFLSSLSVCALGECERGNRRFFRSAAERLPATHFKQFSNDNSQARNHVRAPLNATFILCAAHAATASALVVNGLPFCLNCGSLLFHYTEAMHIYFGILDRNIRN
jgi:hypothetical protein